MTLQVHFAQQLWANLYMSTAVDFLSMFSKYSCMHDAPITVKASSPGLQGRQTCSKCYFDTVFDAFTTNQPLQHNAQRGAH